MAILLTEIGAHMENVGPDKFPKSLMIGVPEIDAEHEAIFRRIHSMAAALAEQHLHGSGWRKV